MTVDLRLRDVEVLEDVALRGLRHRQHPRRAVRREPHRRARVGVAQAVRQVLRKAQVNAVVDRDHRAARRQRRQHVMRRVKEVGPLAPQIQRQRPAARARNSRPIVRARHGSSRRAPRRRHGPRRGTGRCTRCNRRDGRGDAAGCGRRCLCRSHEASGHRWLCALGRHLIVPWRHLETAQPEVIDGTGSQKRSNGVNEENGKEHDLFFSDTSVFSAAPFLRSGTSSPPGRL